LTTPGAERAGNIIFKESMFKLFDDPDLDQHIRLLSLQSSQTPALERREPPLPKKGVLNVGVFAETGYRESGDREEGVVAFFDVVRGFGFVIPAGTDATDKSAHLYLSVHALKRAGISSLAKGDKITFRREESRHVGRKAEAQQIEMA
jgi:cold shock CspA family protein